MYRNLETKQMNKLIKKFKTFRKVPDNWKTAAITTTHKKVIDGRSATTNQSLYWTSKLKYVKKSLYKALTF